MENQPAPATDVEIDFKALVAALRQRLPQLIVFIGLVAVGTYALLAQLAPVYKSETTLIIQSGETSLTAPTQTAADTTTSLDQQAITSQVQIIRSRDLALAVARKLDLIHKSEFDPKANPSVVTRLLRMIGLAKPDTTVATEDRVLDAYFDKLSVYAVDNSRVIGIDFSSTDPQLAADVANAIANEYLSRQKAARRDTTADAAQWLSDQIVDLRNKVQAAEAKVEQYRSEHDLFDTSSSGSTGGGTTLTQQQLTDLNTELTKVRTDRADAQAKASQIRLALQSNSVPNVTDVLNSQLIQNLVAQEVALRSQIAQLNATLLPQHPKMRELNAQLAGLDDQIAAEAGKILDSLEGEAKLAQARESEIQQSLSGLKQTAATANDASVELRALEREAAADRDLLESYLGRYREALAREQGNDLPADARVISRAAVSTAPDFPKKIPMTTAATFAALILAIAFILLKELASGRPMRRVTFAGMAPAAPGVAEADGHARWADDHSIRRMMPKEPTLVPEMVDRVEESLKQITHRIIESGAKRILVTLADGSDSDGRPLGAVALARSLARTDARVVLVDFRGDGADAASMGEGTDLPGFGDLFDGDASFAQVIFRDRKSRVHFIPAGRKPLTRDLVDDERLETVLSALTLTYDYVLLDSSDEMIRVVGPQCGVAMVVSEFGAGDPRTASAFDRVGDVSDAEVMLLVVDPAASRSQDAEAAEGAAA
ncbi:MAG TPA: exopolysaccharide transport family protein [Bauldia sp.]|nr:exopolysaccharide transport family protein [Bauldia sp.]